MFNIQVEGFNYHSVVGVSENFHFQATGVFIKTCFFEVNSTAWTKIYPFFILF